MEQSLPLRSTYIVCPFSEGAGGELTPGRTRNLADRQEAIEVARGIAGTPSRTSAGVMVLEQQTDVMGEVWSEPRLVTVYGRIPESIVRQLAS